MLCRCVTTQRCLSETTGQVAYLRESASEDDMYSTPVGDIEKMNGSLTFSVLFHNIVEYNVLCVLLSRLLFQST